jgi:cytochrome c-type biogenesis protein
MGSLFGALTEAVAGRTPVAVAAALAWGVLSLVLSPCHLASIPLIIGFIGEQGTIPARRAFWLSLLFAAGILVTIGAVGAATAVTGRLLGDLGANVTYVVAVLFFVIGLHFLGVIPLPFPSSGAGKSRRGGRPAAFALGIVFGAAVGPCTFAFMAPMLGVTLSLATDNVTYAMLLLGAYGVGHAAVIVAAGTFAEVVQKYLNWTSTSGGVVVLRRVCGALILTAGVYLIWRG